MSKSPLFNHETRKALEGAAEKIATLASLDEWHELTIRTLGMGYECEREALLLFIQELTPLELPRVIGGMRLGITMAQAFRLAADEKQVAGSN